MGKLKAKAAEMMVFWGLVEWTARRVHAEAGEGGVVCEASRSGDAGSVHTRHDAATVRRR